MGRTSFLRNNNLNSGISLETPFLGRHNLNSGISLEISVFDLSEPFTVSDRPFFPPVFERDFDGGTVGTRVDWMETPQAHVFKADIPGMMKDDVKVEVVDGRTLSISGERKEEKVEKKDAWRRVERSYGKFSRRFGLPENANVAEVGAKVENGVLTVTVPKTHTEAPRVLAVDVQ